jgi:hypothetical protein
MDRDAGIALLKQKAPACVGNDGASNLTMPRQDVVHLPSNRRSSSFHGYRTSENSSVVHPNQLIAYGHDQARKLPPPD